MMPNPVDDDVDYELTVTNQTAELDAFDDASAPAGSGAVTPGSAAVRPLSGLTARDVSAWFGDHKVLERVSLAMDPGTVTALIGPSGCGKSTFLRILNRMHEMVRGAALAGQGLPDSPHNHECGHTPHEGQQAAGEWVP